LVCRRCLILTANKIKERAFQWLIIWTSIKMLGWG
jgi:hypothetical protein